MVVFLELTPRFKKLKRRTSLEFCCVVVCIRFNVASTSEMYSKRFMMSGIGGVKLFVVLNGCLNVLLVSLKKYLRYIFDSIIGKIGI